MIRSLCSLALLVAAAAPASAQTDTLYYVTRLGTDTLAVERMIRTPGRVVIDGVSRSPATRVRNIVIDFDDAGLAGMQMTIRDPNAPADAPPVQSGTATLAGDSLEWTVVTRAGSRTSRVARAAHTIPGVNPFVSGFQLLTDIGVRADVDSMIVGVAGPAQVTPLTFRRVGPGHYLFVGVPAGTAHVWTDAQGRIRRYLASDSEHGVTSEIADRLDIDALARSFAARDAAGAGLGVLSPADSVRATLGGAEISVNYSRPGKRGRVVFGGVVPWGEVWRTGANEATAFTTTRDLMIGTLHVPAGSYTLYSIPARDGDWQLVVSRNTGQWGTQYDPAHDLGRTPMRTRTLDRPVEHFTIAVEGEGRNGMLRLQWDTVEAFVPIVVH